MKLDRLVGMIMVLLNKERISAQALADMFEVSPRTIYRDIDTINMAGIPIHSVPGVGGGFEIMQEFKVNKHVFSNAELSAMLMGLSNLSSIIRGCESVSALAKIKTFIPADSAKDIESKAAQVCMDLNPWIVTGHVQQNLDTIKAALQDNRMLSFAYTAHRGIKTARTVEPYQLISKGGHWYLQGYCHMRNGFRLFRLSRMEALQMERETFTPRVCPKPILDFAEVLASMQREVKLRIHKSILDRVLNYCTSEQVSPDGDEHYIVMFPFIENDYYYDLLLGFGDRCECLEPLTVRWEMRRRIQRIAAIYDQ